MPSVAAEDVARVDFVLDVVEGGVVAVGYDGLALGLEGTEVVDHTAAEEGGAVFEGGFVDDYFGSLGLDAFHNALDGTLTEVVGVGLHGEAIDADDAGVFLAGVETVGVGVAVVAGFLKHGIGYVVLTGAVALHDGLDEVFGYVGVVGKELFGVLGQAVAAVAEGGIVVVSADAGIESNAFDDGAGVETFDFGIGVEFVEVAYAEGEVGVGKEFDGLGFLHAHEEGVDLGLYGAFLKEGGKGLGGFYHLRHVGDGFDGSVFFGKLRTVYEFGVTHNDARGVEIVVEGLALAKELGGEEEIELLDAFAGVFEVEAAGVAYGDGALDDHHGLGVDFKYEVDDFFYVGGVEVVLHRVVVGGGSDDHEVGVGIGGTSVEGSGEVEGLLCQVLLYVVVLDGGDAIVDFLNFLGNDVNGADVMVLGKEGCDAQTDVACSGYGYFYIFKVFHAERIFLCFEHKSHESNESVRMCSPERRENEGDFLFLPQISQIYTDFSCLCVRNQMFSNV